MSKRFKINSLLIVGLILINLLCRLGLEILYKASDLCMADDKIFGIGIDVATKYDAPESIREEIK